MSNDVQILVGTERLEGWTSVSVKRSVDTIAGTFSADMVDIWNLEEAIELYPGLECAVLVAGEKVITGYIDKQVPKVGPTTSNISISGRCKTGDLVDCSATNKPGTWKNIGLRSLVSSLLNPNGNTFNIGLKVGTDLGEKIKEFSINTGESVFEAISRVSQDRAVVPLSTNKGELLLTNIGGNKSSDDLIYGMNLESADGEASFIDRFSEYVVKGQQSGKGRGWNKQTTQKVGKAFDEHIPRFRPKVITADSEISSEGAQKLANWEAQIRAGRSIGVKVSLPTWNQSNGDLWKENLLVYVSIPKLRIDGELLVREVEYTLNGTRRGLNMQLVDPRIYAVKPKKEIKKKTRKSAVPFWLK